MKRIHNKHGPDVDIGCLVVRRARDGIEGRPRDGTLRRPRDETARMPRDGIEGRPRDVTILWMTILTACYFSSRYKRLFDGQIHCRSSLRWRRNRLTGPAIKPVMGEVCPDGTGKNENKNREK